MNRGLCILVSIFQCTAKSSVSTGRASTLLHHVYHLGLAVSPVGWCQLLGVSSCKGNWAWKAWWKRMGWRGAGGYQPSWHFTVGCEELRPSVSILALDWDNRGLSLPFFASNTWGNVSSVSSHWSRPEEPTHATRLWLKDPRVPDSPGYQVCGGGVGRKPRENLDPLPTFIAGPAPRGAPHSGTAGNLRATALPRRPGEQAGAARSLLPRGASGAPLAR